MKKVGICKAEYPHYLVEEYSHSYIEKGKLYILEDSDGFTEIKNPETLDTIVTIYNYQVDLYFDVYLTKEEVLKTIRLHILMDRNKDFEISDTEVVQPFEKEDNLFFGFNGDMIRIRMKYISKPSNHKEIKLIYSILLDISSEKPTHRYSLKFHSNHVDLENMCKFIKFICTH